VKKHLLINIITGLFFIAGLEASQSGTRHYFEQGNQAYREANYPGALEWYHKIEAAGFQSSQVYYNMGNCYYKLNQVGRAILYYEKALKLRPEDAEIQFNLELANLKVVDRLELPPQFFLFEWWDHVKSFFSIQQLSVMVVALYVISILCLILFLFARYHSRRQTIRFLLVLFSIFTLFFTCLLILNIRETSRHKQAIVLTESANVRSAPNEGSTDVFVLHEGVKVTLDEQRGEWVKISLPDGKSGWMRQDLLGII
jgi:tetratricopeptide (TPR) repeat protein